MALRPKFTVPRYDLEVINGVGPKQAYVCPVSPIFRWSDVVTAGGVNVADANPAVQVGLVTSPTKGVFAIEGGATQLLVRCKYNSGISVVSASPTIKIFGRTGSDEWDVLHNAAGSKSVPLTLDLTNDSNDGDGFKCTFVNKALHLFDLKGCNEAIVLVEIALAGTGTVSDAIIQIKPI